MPQPAALTPAIAALILERIAGGESLRQICRSDGMPCRETVRLRLRDDPEFQNQYAAARTDQADTLFDDMLGIADDPALDPQDKRVRIWTRQWMASKLAPKRYGDRVEVTGDPDRPVIAPRDPVESARMIAFALAKADAELRRREEAALRAGPMAD